jgi:hypothetical protein
MSAPQTRQRKSRLSEPREAVTESAKRQVSEVRDVATGAITSGAWAYPIMVSQH